MMLRGYAVLKEVVAQTDRPFKVVRIDIVDNEHGESVTHTVIGGHGSLGIARYWAAMLNEEKYSEEQAQEGLKSGLIE